MEKFFIVSTEHPLYKDYFDWVKNTKQVNEFVKEFMDKWGIETSKYSASDVLYIIPTESDLEKFKGKFIQTIYPNGLRRFRVNSDISKDWKASLQQRNLGIMSQPRPTYYMNGSFRKVSWRLFPVDNILYTSIQTDGNFESPNGFIEIKGSTFYKVMEDDEKND